MVDLLNMRIGLSTIQSNVPWASGFMTLIAARVREEADTRWRRHGARTNAATAAHLIDLAMIGRLHLEDAHYPFRAMRELALRKSSTVSTAQCVLAHALSGFAEQRSGGISVFARPSTATHLKRA